MEVNVDLPAPEGPITVVSVPLANTALMPSSSRVPLPTVSPMFSAITASLLTNGVRSHSTPSCTIRSVLPTVTTSSSRSQIFATRRPLT